MPGQAEDASRQCHCVRCGGRAVHRSTWFRHNPHKRSRLADPDDSGTSIGRIPHAPGQSAVQASPPNYLSPEEASMTPPESSGSTSSDDSDQVGPIYESQATLDVSDPEQGGLEIPRGQAVDDPVSTPAYQENVAANGVRVPVETFVASIQDVVFYTYKVQFGLTKEATAVMLRQRRHDLVSRTPEALDQLVNSLVELHTTKVDACPAGCQAYAGTKEADSECQVCGAPRRTSAGAPIKQVTYWSLIPWLTAMVVDPVLGSEMLTTMKSAREAATKPIDQIRDWYDGSSFRKLVADGYFTADTDIALSLSTDGFEAFRQQGFDTWPIVVTVLNLEPSRRSRVVSQLILCVTPGPGQPADLESFFHPVIAELNQLSQGISGVKVAGLDETVTLRAYLLQVTSDMPAGDKVLNMTGNGGRTPGRLRNFQGVYSGTRYYYPPKHPHTGQPLFSIGQPSQDRRSTSGFAANVNQVARLRSEPGPRSAVEELVKNCGIKGHSLLSCPSTEDEERYPHLKYLRSLGPSLVPYDTMHLILSNVVPRLWDLFAGRWTVPGGSTEEYALTQAHAALIGREIRGARATVPRAQARALRDVNLHHKSYKAVDWMYFILSTAQPTLAGRLPDAYFNMVMCLSLACRLLFRPTPLSRSDVSSIRTNLRDFCTTFYDKVYRHQPDRLSLCRLPIAILLDVVPNLMSCGPAWVWWQFPTERAIGTLSSLIRSRSRPHMALTNAITRKYEAELLTAFGETNCPSQWAFATGTPASAGLAKGSYAFPSNDDIQVMLLPPSLAPEELSDTELEHMKAALRLEDVRELPDVILAKKYFRVELGSGVVAGSARLRSEARRRNWLLAIDSEDRRQARNGAVEVFRRTSYGEALHYAVVLMDQPMVFAYIECVKSSADRSGKYGFAEKFREMECFSSLGGSRKYVPLLAVSSPVGTLFREGRHFVLFSRQPFSNL